MGRGTFALIGALAVAVQAAVSSAADLPAAPPAGVVVAPAPPPATAWFEGGRRWRGHHDWDWGSDPHHSYATYGWKQPWYFAPRQPSYAPYQPKAEFSYAIAGSIYSEAPPAWTPDWYAHCARRYHNFEPATGLFTNRFGQKEMCR